MRPVSRGARTPPTAVKSPARARVLACAAAALLGGLVYVNALHNPFVYDDFHTVVDNTSLKNPANLLSIVHHDVARPLVNVSYAFDRAIWGTGPFGFHLTSVLLHVLNVVLLFQLAWRLTEDWRARGEEKATPLAPLTVAFATAVLFAVHPMLTEAVGYISGRSEVLCATFFLLATLSGMRWARGDGTRWAVAAIGLWLAALATKEIAAMFPFVFFAYDWLVAPDEGRRRRTMILHGPLMAIAALAGAARLAFFVWVEHPGHTNIQWPYALVEIDVARRYLLLMLAPNGQSIFHEVTLIRSPLEWRGVLAIGSIGGLLALAWIVRRELGAAALGVLWFLALLVPSAALVVLDLGEPMTEHRVYLASCGLLIAVGASIGLFMARLADVSSRMRLLAQAVLALAVLSLAGQTVLRNTVWASPVTLWAEAVERAPDHWRPRLLYGEALQDAGRRAEAVAQYRTGLQMRPSEKFGYMKLGLCLAEMGRLDEAAATFDELRRLDPKSAVASTGLGAVAMLAGRTDRARQYFLETIEMDPRNVSARQSLAILDEMEPANPAEALRLCEEIQRLAPETPGNDECIRRNRSRLGGTGSDRR